jgi:fatty-acid desaturase
MKTNFIEVIKSITIKDVMICIDFACAIGAVITGLIIALNIVAIIKGGIPGDKLMELVILFLIFSCIWLVNSLFSFIREFRKSI